MMPATINRIALVAGYDPGGIIHDHVVHLVRSLARFATVHYYCDNPLAPGQAERLAGLAQIVGADRHGAYDFGSWARMLALLGPGLAAACDELILVNDSCYGPFTDLLPICDAMSARPCDFWGMTASPEVAWHVQSYFAVFKRPVLQDSAFAAFWSRVQAERRYQDVVEKYEVGLSRLLIGRGFAPDVHVHSRLPENLTTFPLSLLGPGLSPFVKVKCFADPYIGSRERIGLLFRHIRRTHPQLARMIARHQGPGFLTRAFAVQRAEPPFFFRVGHVRIRSIRHNRLKLTWPGGSRIILPVGRRIARRLSRLSAKRSPL